MAERILVTCDRCGKVDPVKRRRITVHGTGQQADNTLDVCGRCGRAVMECINADVAPATDEEESA